MSGFITPEGLVIPLGSDTYDYVNDQKRLSSSIRSLVPVANNTGFNTVSTAMNADGRPTSDTNPLFAWNAAAKGLQYQGTGAGPLPLMAAIPFAHAGVTAGFQAIGTTATVINIAAAQHLAGGITFASNALTVPIAGYYRINWAYYTSAAVTCYVYCNVLKNGVGTGMGLRYNKTTTGEDYIHHGTGVILLAANDTISLSGQHGNASLNTFGSTGFDGTYMELEYMGAV